MHSFNLLLSHFDPDNHDAWCVFILLYRTSLLPYLSHWTLAVVHIDRCGWTRVERRRELRNGNRQLLQKLVKHNKYMKSIEINWILTVSFRIHASIRCGPFMVHCVSKAASETELLQKKYYRRTLWHYLKWRTKSHRIKSIPLLINPTVPLSSIVLSIVSISSSSSIIARLITVASRVLRVTVAAAMESWIYRIQSVLDRIPDRTWVHRPPHVDNRRPSCRHCLRLKTQSGPPGTGRLIHWVKHKYDKL